MTDSAQEGTADMAQRAVRRGRATAIAVAAMAALTASQAPGAVTARATQPAPEAPVERVPSVSGDTPYRTELPPLRGPERREAEKRTAGVAPVAGALPASVFAAYRRAEEELARTDPGCGLRWQLLAAIGQVESGQARGGRVAADGTTLTPILGPRLDGDGFAEIRDTDGGAHDGDTAYDRAVGPMQFIPSTWAVWGADGNGDGRADPNNVHDAALAAGRYLCAGDRDLSQPADLDRAILGYNRSRAYLRTVRAWYEYLLDGHRVVPDAAASPAEPSPAPSRTRSATPAPKPSPRSERGGASPTPTAPVAPSSPSPGPSRTAIAPEEPEEPVAPLPSTGVGLSPDDALPLVGGDDGPLPTR
ncbi:lytic transglycosylase domain-containing protein [Streptomyces sp. NEAU-NA10]|uniref:lytic transglycosylase domain-containing protein n=1 Tax=Streptomyces sp. NEAU-NA10 TaxID=3416050 RepID=UPI003CC55112